MTNEEKQIEEMAKDVCANCMDEICASGRCEFQYDCPLDMDTVKRLYLKGYRKSSDVAREIFAEIEKTVRGVLILIPFSYKDNLKTVECKKECYQDFIEYIAELQKRYESEGEKDNGKDNK